MFEDEVERGLLRQGANQPYIGSLKANFTPILGGETIEGAVVDREESDARLFNQSMK